MMTVMVMAVKLASEYSGDSDCNGGGGGVVDKDDGGGGDFGSM